MQKQLDEASKQTQEEIKSLSQGTTILRRENRRVGCVSKVHGRLEDLQTHELKANNIALQVPSRTRRNRSISLDRSQSLVKRLPQLIRELQETVNVSQESAELKDPELANSDESGRTFTSKVCTKQRL